MYTSYIGYTNTKIFKNQSFLFQLQPHQNLGLRSNLSLFGAKIKKKRNFLRRLTFWTHIYKREKAWFYVYSFKFMDDSETWFCNHFWQEIFIYLALNMFCQNASIYVFHSLLRSERSSKNNVGAYVRAYTIAQTLTHKSSFREVILHSIFFNKSSFREIILHKKLLNKMFPK